MDRILYFDCFAGISGDMTIAALLDLGLDETTVLEELDKLGVSGYEIRIQKKNSFSISGTDVKISLTGETDCVHHHEGHGVEHDHHHHHDHKERSLTDISHIINSSKITENAKRIAIKIFTEIANAEAIVHGKSVGEVHFHEVGAVDSIVDIVGTAICIDMLQVDQIYCSPVHEGQGFVECQHGRLPIPVPAVVQMMGDSGISVITEDIQAELVTPTGFAILKTIKQGCGRMPEMQVQKVGYGFGKTQTGSLNALRVVLGTSGTENIEKVEHTSQISMDHVMLLETNLDDCSGEMLGYVIDLLMSKGALDAYFTPIFMKKNRPATMLSVICMKSDLEEMAQIIFSETSTLGIRKTELERMILPREIQTIQTSFGAVRVKVSNWNGKRTIKPEYDDCIRIAKEENLPLKDVISIIYKKFNEDN